MVMQEFRMSPYMVITNSSSSLVDHSHQINQHVTVISTVWLSEVCSHRELQPCIFLFSGGLERFWAQIMVPATRWRLKYVWGQARKISKTPSSGDKDKNPWFLELRHSIKEFHVWNHCLFCQTRGLTTGLTSCLPRYFNYQPLGNPMLSNYGIVCQKTMG